MKMIYLACPYTHPDIEVRAKRLQAADYYAALLIETGIGAVFSPITHGVRLEPHLSRAKVESHDFWMEQCIAVLRKCDELVVLPLIGWKESKGVKMEIRLANSMQLPVRYIQDTQRKGLYQPNERGLEQLPYASEIVQWL